MAAGRVEPPMSGLPRASGAAGGATVRIRSHDGVRVVPAELVRLEHFADSVPWRRWRSYHGQPHLSGSYWAATIGDHLVYESRLELERLLLADFDARITAMWAQPCLLSRLVDGVERRHVPDFLFATGDGAVTVVNVKPAARLLEPKIAAALAWPGTVFRAHGWGYEIWSGEARPVVENVRFLAGYRRPGLVDERAIEQAWAQVVDGEPLGDAERRLAAGAPGWTARPMLLALLWRRRLATDLRRPLSTASMLRRCS